MSLISLAMAIGLIASPALAQGPPGGGGPPGGAGASSPAYNYIFQNPLPIPEVATPQFSEQIDGRTIDYYQMEIKPVQKQIYPNLPSPANMVGYGGAVPGPTYKIQRGHETVVRCLNNGGSNASMHLHGSYTHSAWDGWAADEMEVNQFKDYYYPNSEFARSIWYHDHAEGNTSNNAYYGQAGIYIIYDPEEDALGLPSGDYDVPLAIVDKLYQSNGDLASPYTNNNGLNGFYGDVIEVNGQPWPYLSVEPRKYRFRLFDMSLSRPYDLWFSDPNGNAISFTVIASDSGLFGKSVTSSDVVIAMGERYEVVVDFSQYAGKNITLKNKGVPTITNFANTDKIMQFNVGNSVSDNSNNGAVPSTLNPNVNWPTPKTSVDYTFQFQQGGDNRWTINGIDFEDTNNRILAKPPLGSTQLWTLHHAGGFAVHPVHIHLVNLQVISRTGGSRGVLPYEAAGLKDTVLLEPGETAQVLAYYGPWDGVYMFHCHNLVHEDHAMLAAFNVTLLESLGYTLNSTLDFSNPMDSRFAPQDYSADAYEPAAISSAVSSLASLGAYQAATSVASSLSAKSTGATTTTGSARATTTPTGSGTATGTTTSTTAAATTTKKHKKHKTRVKVHKHKKTTTGAAAATSTVA